MWVFKHSVCYTQVVTGGSLAQVQTAAEEDKAEAQAVLHSLWYAHVMICIHTWVVICTAYYINTIYIYTYMYMYMDVYIYIYICFFFCVCIYIYNLIHRLWPGARKSAEEDEAEDEASYTDCHIYIYICTYVRMYIYKYVCLYIFIHIYIYTSIYIQIHLSIHV